MPKYAIHSCHDCLKDFGSDKLFQCTVGGRIPHSILLCIDCMDSKKRHNPVIGKKAYKKSSKYMKEYFDVKTH